MKGISNRSLQVMEIDLDSEYVPLMEELINGKSCKCFFVLSENQDLPWNGSLYATSIFCEGLFVYSNADKEILITYAPGTGNSNGGSATVDGSGFYVGAFVPNGVLNYYYFNITIRFPNGTNIAQNPQTYYYDIYFILDD